jgi:hypothetical protein
MKKFGQKKWNRGNILEDMVEERAGRSFLGPDLLRSGWMRRSEVTSPCSSAVEREERKKRMGVGEKNRLP